MKLALIALLVAAPAQAAERPCVTHAQLEALTLFALPPVLEALATKCGPSLPAQAYLLNGGRALSQSLAADSAANWEGATAAMHVVAGEMPAGVSQETMRGLIRDMTVSELKLKPQECARIDRLGELLAPLPPRNLARVVAMLAELGMNDGGKKKKKPRPSICPAP